jgi:hypothetical protein
MLVPLFLAGCSKQEGQQAVQPSAHSQQAKKEAIVVVPAIVKGKWKAVKIAVTDKEKSKETVYTVAIGASFTIPATSLTINVDNFLPHFMMDGTTLTSQTNEPKNPAAQIRITENGTEIFKGWLFSLYPTTHAFQHPRFSFTLVDFIPAS